jgi:hypothetical protein
MPPDFQIFDCLRRHNVPFVIVGGHAVNYHGYRRATEDSDVIWLRSPESQAALFAALTELRASYITREIDPATGIERTASDTPAFIEVNHLMMLWTVCGFIDLFDYVPGFPDANVQEVLDTSVTDSDGFRFASLTWLRRMKEVVKRPKDQLDLENLPEE